MISEFIIKNFTSVRDEQRLSFVPSADTKLSDEYMLEVRPGVKLLKIGVIYGNNASGKSNVLKALEFVRKVMTEMPSDKLSLIDVVPFLLDDASRNSPTEFAMTFYLQQVRYTLTLVLDSNRIHLEELTLAESSKPALLYRRTYHSELDRSQVTFGTKVKISKEDRQAIIANTINNCTVLAAFGKANVSTSRLNQVYEFFASGLKPLLTPDTMLARFVKQSLESSPKHSLKQFVVEMLRLSDFNIVDFNLTREPKAILTFEHRTTEGVYSLPEQMESVGTVRFMAMAIILDTLLSGNSIVTIDEIESSIHYELLSYFIKVFLANCRNNAQLLLTTHDINLLNEDYIRRDVVWFTDKAAQGNTALLRLSDLGLHKTLSPYNAYRQGKLINLPFLGSIYLPQNED